MRALALLLLLLPAQEPPRVNLDRSGTIEEAVQALSAASGAAIKVLPEVDPKSFPVRVSGATFFEALDAVCRAHGQARYFNPPQGPDEGTIEIRPAPWLDYPSSYAPDFKIIVPELVSFTSATSVGNQRWNRVSLALFGAPWLRVQDETGAKALWTIEEATDADGVDVKPAPRDPEPAQAIDFVYNPRYFKGNVVSRMFRLKPFDADRGLQILKGSVQLTVCTMKDVAIPLAAGKSVETSAGTLTVESLGTPQDTPLGPTYRVGFSLKPAAGIKTLRQGLEARFRCEGKDFDSRLLTIAFPRDGFAFDVVIRRAAALPAAIHFLVREGERRVTVPFSFKNLRF